MATTCTVQKKTVILSAPGNLNRQTMRREESHSWGMSTPWWASTDLMAARDERAIALFTLLALVAASMQF